jgi:diacylglycerol kinase family enzyme
MTTRHLFIINPTAGKVDRSPALKKQIQDLFYAKNIPCTCMVTKGPMDAARIVCREAERGGQLRVYACGGDGTLNEVINGAALYSNVAVTHIPIGSGNDFVKQFGPNAAALFHVEVTLDRFTQANQAEADQVTRPRGHPNKPPAETSAVFFLPAIRMSQGVLGPDGLPALPADQFHQRHPPPL